MRDKRYARFLRGRYRILLGYVGLIDVLVGGLILSPCLLLPAFPKELSVVWGLVAPGLGLVAIGGVLWRVCLPRGGESLTLQEGAVVVVLSWISAVLVGALPFMAVGGLNFTQAVFESTSGWTTTGLSVVDVTAAPRLLLLYRSVMQLAGGVGLAVIMLSALAGPAGTGLSAAEGRADQLVPNVRRSAKLVVTIYSGLYVLNRVEEARGNLTRAKDILIAIGKSDGEPLRIAAREAEAMIDRLLLAMEQSPEDVSKLFQSIGHKVNMLAIKGDLVLSGAHFPEEQ